VDVAFARPPYRYDSAQTKGTDSFSDPGSKRKRTRLEIENFSGISAQVVPQDFYAKMFVLNLSTILACVAQAITDRPYQARKRAYRVNFANAVAKMRDNVVRLFVQGSPMQLLTALMLSMAASVEAVRLERSYPRKIKTGKLDGFHRNYKRSR
jgi:hypothetical protein